jgi:hypothetical protein
MAIFSHPIESCEFNGDYQPVDPPQASRPAASYDLKQERRNGPRELAKRSWEPTSTGVPI